ncbi:MAG: hypothetical protein OEU26_18530 [Candidatus Tectomicrobia bacterium]|nr:hypothetical protein [Candidatus Tectomicrobia bacterium]
MRTQVRMIPIFVLCFFILDAFMGTAYFLDKLFGSPVKELSIFVNLNREGNLPTWYSSLQLFVVGSLLGLFTWRNLDWHNRRSWLLPVLPLLFWLMSLDEVAQVHEKIGVLSHAALTNVDLEQTIFPKTGYWIIVVGVPFLIVVMSLFSAIRSYLTNPPHLIRLFLIGLCIMMIGALGVETLHNFVGSKGSMLRFMLIFGEEVCEMFGVTVMLWATVDLLQANGFKIELKAVHQSSAPALSLAGERG